MGRARQRLTLSQLSELTGVSRAYLNFLENGVRKSMNMKLYKKLCEALHISKIEMIEAIVSDLKNEVLEAWGEEE